MSIQNAHTRVVPLSTLPTDTTTTLNGVPTKLEGNTRLPIGTYTITASKEGFSTRTVQLVVEDSVDYENYEPIALSPVSEEAVKWVEENSQLYGDDLYSSLNHIDPVFAYLPSNGLIYKLDSDSTSSPIVLNAASLGNYKNAPIDYLKRSGIDPSNYSYTFNYKNPFDVSGNE